MRHYDWYILLRKTYFERIDDGVVKRTMSGAVIFMYNFSVDAQNRCCTITGCFGIKSFYTSESSYWESCSPQAKGTQDHWLNNSSSSPDYHTWGTISIGNDVKSFDLPNYRGGNWSNNFGTGELVQVDNIVTKGGDGVGNGSQWYGGVWKYTNEQSFTFYYGDNDTQPTATMNMNCKFATNWKNGWKEWSGSGNIILPYIEASSLINRTNNYGASWGKTQRLYKTTNGGVTWTKIKLKKTTNGGSSWSDIM